MTREELNKIIAKAKPEKPRFETDGYHDDGKPVCIAWHCPCCDSEYEMWYDHHDYCPNCGQHIDWNEYDTAQELWRQRMKNDKSRKI